MIINNMSISIILLVILFWIPFVNNGGAESFIVSEGNEMDTKSRTVFVDSTGNVVLEVPGVIEARSFSEGLAAYMTDKWKWGFINKRGETVIEPLYDEVGNFSEGYARVQLENRKWSFVNGKGFHSFNFQFDKAHDFSEGIALVETNGSVFKLNKDGNLTSLFKEDTFGLYADDGNSKFTDGLALIYSDTNKFFGYIGTDGLISIEPQFKRAKPFSEGVAIVSVEVGGREMATLINTRGEMLFPPRFDIDFDLLRNTSNFSEGLFGISPPPNMEADSTFSYANKQGEIVIETKFLYADSFHEGLALVWDSRTDKWGFIDKKGEVAIPVIYSSAEKFSEGLALVKN